MFFRRKKHTETAQSARTRSQQRPPQDRVISYYTASRRQLDSFERKQASDDFVAKRHFRQLRKHWFFASMALVGLVFVAAAATLNGSAYVRVEPVAYRDASEYQRVINDALQQDWRNFAKPLIQKAALEQQLYEALPEARSVEVSAPLLGRQAAIDIMTDQPLAWFDQTGVSSLVLGERGKLLVPADAVNSQTTLNRTTLPAMRNTSGVSAKAGDQILSPGEAKALSKLLFQIRQDGGSLPQLEYGQSLREIVFREPSRGGYAVRVLLNDDIEQQYGALRAVQKDFESRGIRPIEYIDVRLIDRVYYK